LAVSGQPLHNLNCAKLIPAGELGQVRVCSCGAEKPRSLDDVNGEEWNTASAAYRNKIASPKFPGYSMLDEHHGQDHDEAGTVPPVDSEDLAATLTRWWVQKAEEEARELVPKGDPGYCKLVLGSVEYEVCRIEEVPENEHLGRKTQNSTSNAAKTGTPKPDEKRLSITVRTAPVAGRTSTSSSASTTSEAGATSTGKLSRQGHSQLGSGGTAGRTDTKSSATTATSQPQMDESALTKWWMNKAREEISALAPKAEEYGGAHRASDLVQLGRTIAELTGFDADTRRLRGLDTDAFYQELACYFYLQGKMGRWQAALLEGRQVSDDTIHDIKIYTTMVQRIREQGGWPV
jgi:hypothetical protein